MTAEPTAFPGGTAVAAALVAATLVGFVAPVQATPAWLQHALEAAEGENGKPAPRVAHYEIEDGGGFVLDLSSRPPMVRFDDSPEIWVLYGARGPRGDVIYRDDLGEVILRGTKLGGMTVFTPRRPEGSAAALAGPASPLRLTPLGPVGSAQRVVLASVRSSRWAQRLVGFDATFPVDIASATLVADAAAIAAQAIATVAAKPGGRAAIAHLGRVELVKSPRAGASYQYGVLTVMINPAQGFAGRPSSRRIAYALADR